MSDSGPIVPLVNNLMSEGSTPRVVTNNSFMYLLHNVGALLPINTLEKWGVEASLVNDVVTNAWPRSYLWGGFPP